jgi:hypothetical protein
MENQNPLDEQFNELTQSEPAVKGPSKQELLNQHYANLRAHQNLPLGILAGFGASLVGAVIWAVVTVATGYQIGYLAVGVGFLVGMAIRYVGKGFDMPFGIAGAALALFGCVFGNFLSIIGFIANAQGIGYFETLMAIDYSLVPSLMMETFQIMDLLFYGIAIYEGFKFSMNTLEGEEIASM